MAQRLFWIDNVKAICMIGVYLLHSEAYYGFGDIQYGMLITPFYVNAFFFVSGYLMFNKYLNVSALGNNLVYVKALQNIVFRLMIPSLFFSAVMFVPKMLFHSAEVSVPAFLLYVLGGISYWFTSALSVAQIVLLLLVMSLKRKDIWSYMWCSVLLFALGWYLNDIRTDTSADAFFPWFWKTGLEYTLIMALGGIYMKYENHIHAMRHILFTFSIVIYVVSMYMLMNGMTFALMGLGGRCNIKGGILILAGISLIVSLSHILKENRILSYIGRNSLVFYFLSGVLPAFWGNVAQRFFPEKMYVVTIVVALLSLLLAWVATVVINKYLPFLIDIRKLQCQHTKPRI